MASTITQLQTKIDGLVARADEVLAARLRREVETLERENAARAEEARVKALRNAERCRDHQARYADALEAFGVHAPMAVDGERSVDFRDRLFDAAVRRLPPGHRLARLRADDLSTSTMNGFEPELLEAVKQEGHTPSEANLPADGSMISRTRTDSQTGAKTVEWYGKRSFIHDFARPGRKVLRLVDPRTGRVLLGAPFSTAF